MMSSLLYNIMTLDDDDVIIVPDDIIIKADWWDLDVSLSLSLSFIKRLVATDKTKIVTQKQ